LGAFHDQGTILGTNKWGSDLLNKGPKGGHISKRAARWTPAPWNRLALGNFRGGETGDTLLPTPGIKTPPKPKRRGGRRNKEKSTGHRLRKT